MGNDCEWDMAGLFGLPRRFDPIDLLTTTSVSCLTRIAENTSVPPSLLEHLALHPDAAIREAVADNENTPVDTLWLLLNDESADVRYAIAENHNKPIAILSMLTRDENPYVSSRAELTLLRLGGAQILKGDFKDRGQASARIS